jgi:transposase InsO family protein
LSEEARVRVRSAIARRPGLRLKAVVSAMGWAHSSFFRRPSASKRRPGPAPKPLDAELVEIARGFALMYPFWGYKKLAVILRRAGVGVSNRFVYRALKQLDMLQRRKPRAAALYQAARLFELLPQKVNDLWQADVTYIHIPGFGWWYAVTVIDYFSRYLLAIHFTEHNNAAALIAAIDKARAEAERIHGALAKPPILVTDNGSNFISRRFRMHIDGLLSQVRTQYRTPEQLGLLERFHETLKREEVYWQIYSSPTEARTRLEAFRELYNEIRPHWALQPTAGGDVVTPTDVYRHGVEIQLPAWQGWAKAAKEKLQKLMDQESIAA